VEGEVADVGERRFRADDLPGGGGRLGACGVIQVRGEGGEPLDPEDGEILPRHPGVVLDEDDRLPARELQGLPEHALELQLIDELGQAHEERGRAVAVADREEGVSALAAQPRDVALEDRAAADALREGRERRHAGTASAK